MKPHEVFLPELNVISDKGIRELVTDVLQKLEVANVYFYKAPASRSKVHHPPCCNVQSGLVRHVKRAVHIGRHLCRAYGVSPREEDIIIAALLLHDIWKNDFKKHASRAGQYILDIIAQNHEKYGPIGTEALAQIIKAIRYHMGLWTEPDIKKPIAEYTLIELIVYTADYISSRNEIAIPIQDECDLTIEFPGEDLVKGGVQ